MFQKNLKVKLLGLALLVFAIAILNAGCSFSGKEASASSSMPVLKLDSIVTNLAEPRRYIRITPVLSFYNYAEKKAAEAETDKLREAIIFALRHKTVKDLGDTDSLKKDLVSAVNRALQSNGVTGIHFEELLVQ